MRQRIWTGALMAAAAFALSTPQAHANSVLEIISGNTVHSFSGSAGGIALGTSVSINGWTVAFAEGFTSPALGTLAMPIDDIASLNIMHTGNAPLYIEFSANGFTTPTPGIMEATMSGVNSGIGSLTGTYSTYFGPGNSLFSGTGAHPLPTSGLLTTENFTAGTLDGSLFGTVTGSDPFSLTQIIEITAGEGSFDDSLAAIPPPPTPGVPDGGMTMTLMSGALLALGGLRRKLGR